MKSYSLNLLIHITLLILSAIFIGISIVSGILWLILCSTLCTCIIGGRLILQNQKETKELKRFVNSVRFAEFNIPFENSHKRIIPYSLSADIENAVDCFNERMRRHETKLNFYDILSDNIEFAVIVAEKNKEGQIVWMNKKAKEMLRRSRAQTINFMRKIFPEYPYILSKMVPEEVVIVRYDTKDLKANLAVTMTLISVRNKEYKTFSFKNIQPIINEIEGESWKQLIHVLANEIEFSIKPIISLAKAFADPNIDYDYLTIVKAMHTINKRCEGLEQLTSNYQQLTCTYHPQKYYYRIYDCLTNIIDPLKADGINCSFHVDPEDMRVQMDRNLMEEVITRLVINAWQACENVNNAKIVVNVMYDQYMRPLIKVLDNGTGIPPNIIDKIFIPFYTTKRNKSGIGLSICRQIVSAHGGTINVESEPDKGTCFTIRL